MKRFLSTAVIGMSFFCGQSFADSGQHQIHQQQCNKPSTCQQPLPPPQDCPAPPPPQDCPAPPPPQVCQPLCPTFLPLHDVIDCSQRTRFTAHRLARKARRLAETGSHNRQAYKSLSDVDYEHMRAFAIKPELASRNMHYLLKHDVPKSAVNALMAEITEYYMEVSKLAPDITDRMGNTFKKLVKHVNSLK